MFCLQLQAVLTIINDETPRTYTHSRNLAEYYPVECRIPFWSGAPPPPPASPTLALPLNSAARGISTYEPEKQRLGKFNDKLTDHMV
jgi:hypothetical protein